MKKNGTGGMLGKVTVATVAMMSMFCGNAVAKEADVPVNMMFSRNIDMVKSSEVTECSAEEAIFAGEFQGMTSINEDSFVEFVPMDTEDTTYEIICDGKTIHVLDQSQNQIEPQHVHKLVDTTIKEHKKNKMAPARLHTMKGKNVHPVGQYGKAM